MLYVEADNTIKLTRGDTAYLEVPLVDDTTGETYEMQPGDKLTLSVKKNVKDATCCFQKVVEGSNIFKVLPEDTAGCDFAKYKYDIQLDTAAGDTFTVIEPACFTVMPEVT